MKVKIYVICRNYYPSSPLPPPQKKIWEVKQGYKNANEAVKKGS